MIKKYSGMNWKSINYWNRNSYGSAFRIKRNHLIAALIVVCIITPATNWLIPFIKKSINKDVILRYDTRRY